MTTPQSLEALLALANAAAEVGDDMNEAVKGGGGGKLLPEGFCIGTLVEYVEFGQQPQEFNGVAKDPALEFQLGFALWGEGYQNDDGTPYIFRPYPMALSRNEKATAFLTFKAMNWKGTAKHFAQLLGQSFLLKVVHKKPKDQTQKVKSVLDLKATLPPLDALTKQPYPVPPVPADKLKLFLWSHPTVEAFASFYQEGKYDDGNSKNSVQEKMLSALDFHGSPLHMLLIEKQVPFTVPAPKAKAAAPAAPAAPSPAAPAVPAQPVAMPNAAPAPAVPQPTAAAAPTPAPVATPAPAAVATPAPTPVPAAAAPAMPAMPSIPAMPAMPAIPAV